MAGKQEQQRKAQAIDQADVAGAGNEPRNPGTDRDRNESLDRNPDVNRQEGSSQRQEDRSGTTNEGDRSTGQGTGDESATRANPERGQQRR